LFPI